MKAPKVVAIITARGGSKRLPRKNVLSFCGLPLVEWSIIQCCCAHCLGPENTYLSTDNEEIAELGKKHNINIIRRPNWKNPDALSATPVTVHAIETIRKDRKFDLFINRLPTSPIVLPDDIDRTYRRYCELKQLYPDCSNIIWTIPQREMVVHKYLDNARMIHWLWNKKWWFGGQGVHANIHEPDSYIHVLSEFGNDADLDNTDNWLKPDRYLGKMLYYIQGKWFQAFEIDDQDSFELCEIMMERYVLKGRGAKIYTDYRDGAT